MGKKYFDVAVKVVAKGNGINIKNHLLNLMSRTYTPEQPENAIVLMGLKYNKDEVSLILHNIPYKKDVVVDIVLTELGQVIKAWWNFILLESEREIVDLAEMMVFDLLKGRFVEKTHYIKDFISEHEASLKVCIVDENPITPDTPVLNEEDKGKEGIDLYSFYVEHETSRECTVEVYASSPEEAEEYVREAAEEGDLPYEDSSVWGDAQITDTTD